MTKWSPGCHCTCAACSSCATANAHFGYNNLTLSGCAPSATLINAREQYNNCTGGGPAATTWTFPGFAGGSTSWLDSTCGGNVGNSVTRSTNDQAFMGALVPSYPSNPCAYRAWHLSSTLWGLNQTAEVTASYAASCASGTPVYIFSLTASYKVEVMTYFTTVGIGLNPADYPDWSWVGFDTSNIVGTYSAGGIDYEFEGDLIANVGANDLFQITLSGLTSSATSITLPPKPVWDLMGLLKGTATLS